MRNWQSKKRSHFPLQVAIVLFVFFIFSILYNEINFQLQQILPHPTQNHHHHQEQQYLDAGLNNGYNNDDDDDWSLKTEEHIPLKPTALLNQTPTPPPPAPTPPVPLDKSSTCTTNVEYKRRRVAPPQIISTRRDDGRGGGLIGEAEGEECDLFSGRWVYDNTTHPMYDESECPYMSDQLACQRHGRPDSLYQHWRWQPHNCNLKRWNATEMLEKLRGKKLMFVGDSLNRGQWLSLVCLLQLKLPADKHSMTPQSHITTFRAEEYNATIEFLWAPLLVESNSDHPVEHRLPQRIVRPDSTLRHSSEWKHADIVVFNSFLWWAQMPVNLSWSDAPSGVCEEVNGMVGLELAVEAWADWMASNFDFLKKRAFWVTMSPEHLLKGRWDPRGEGNCYGELLPISSETHFESATHIYWPVMEIVNKFVRRVFPQVQVMDITRLSDYRKDAHPGVYRKFWEILTPEKLAKPSSYADCLHWCLPGLQDVWNEIFFQFF